ncbi:MAG: hypothetical protein A3F31_04010 [Candidatus Levybacteria bacterium RIFCSPHIGHO2_12_FULL_38_12]|nr:MAG: hypothetical protein A2770_02400 [Candidatus Levybacteria bacterium RIFCSPHIGHO2_01_FULL_38_12]OGH21930.1 MAG: hypothetical protein A3D75_00620 [Candidatus Levybacteria bacterium RIFCSPHIGHO2_02_FULL_37_18]OGH22862.1 MAG: hypothetical protein A3F31_04010 [Candidatus Levybacteria bacterium RIFCSPHIGHO2_12_FULL_38_12]OGH33587.1 MAG: hypothetical protein A3A47_01965 [Candidatus Levybacteria bacterium RIFCSPLOWO2_01_FULL_37_20]OGH44508.1 MAG: hypothetical protein A3J14_03655 [Candidatus Lev
MKKKRKTSPQKTIYHYALRIFISMMLGVAVFITGKHFLKPPIPCANSLTCVSDLSLKIENGSIGMFQGRKVTPPAIDLALDTSTNVLGVSFPIGEKHIYVDLASQSLYAYQGKTRVLETYVSTGRWGKTPVGNFHIWQKLRATRMAGGAGDDAYDLPNVPYVMYFFRDFGLHGAYWHDNFGHTMSHGCVNLRQVDAQALFNWANGPTNGEKGTAVSICNNFIKPNKCIQDNPVQ